MGTTDNDYDQPDLDHIRPGEDDVAYLLDAVNRFFATDLGAGDITGAFAGVRPLISTGDPKKSVDISRKAELYETSSGMITITGGKLTTWRRMAKMAVDRLVEREARDAPCRTHEIPLGQAIEERDLPRVEGVPEGAYAQLAGRYGYAAHDVLAIAAGHRRPTAVGPARAGPARRVRRAGRPAGRGRLRGAPRAGPRRGRRAAAPHPAGAAGRAARWPTRPGPPRAASRTPWPPSWAGTSAAWRPRWARSCDEAAAEGIVAGAS